jgi:hypothetical protein
LRISRGDGKDGDKPKAARVTRIYARGGSNSATLFGIDSIPLISHAQYMDVDAGFITKINTHLSAFADAGCQVAVSRQYLSLLIMLQSITTTIALLLCDPVRQGLCS